MNQQLTSHPMFCQPSAEFLGLTPIAGGDDAIKFIEKCGRVCYKSEDRITPESATKFFNGLISKEHYSVIEHSNIVIRSMMYVPSLERRIRLALGDHCRFFTISWKNDFLFISANLRAWVEAFADGSSALKDLPLVKELRSHVASLFPTVVAPADNLIRPEFCVILDPNEVPAAHRRYTFRFICDRGISHELVRHRPASFSQESTRYVNYKNRPIQFIIPCYPVDLENHWKEHMFDCANLYNKLVGPGYEWTPSQARSILPNALKTEVIMTTNYSHLLFLHQLRSSPKAHCQMIQLMNLINPILEGIKNDIKFNYRGN